MSDFFNEAHRRARSRFTPEQWVALTPQQVTEAIYQAMREMDAETAGQITIHPRAKSSKTAPDNAGNEPAPDNAGNEPAPDNAGNEP